MCEECINKNSKLCVECKYNPKYAKYLKLKSHYKEYKPTCPRGYTDCVYDPAYIKSVDAEWYKELYGDKTPEEAAEDCRKKVKADPEEKYGCYDDEDK